jgi:acetyltransferase
MLPHRGFEHDLCGEHGIASGAVAFISQSGALCTAVLDWSLRENVGFSAFISVGSMADIGWGDLISWLGDDPHTRSIVLYMETIGDARSFLSAAREVSFTKPIIVIKVVTLLRGLPRAAASHTGSMTAAMRCSTRRLDEWVYYGSTRSRKSSTWRRCLANSHGLMVHVWRW